MHSTFLQCAVCKIFHISVIVLVIFQLGYPGLIRPSASKGEQVTLRCAVCTHHARVPSLTRLFDLTIYLKLPIWEEISQFEEYADVELDLIYLLKAWRNPVQRNWVFVCLTKNS